MKTKLYDVNGKEKGSIELPKSFSSKIREDIVTKVIEVKKQMQPYGPNLLAGMKQSAKGKIRHRRHVWQTHYGRGLSRIPRKVMSRRGTQFNWEGAEVPFARGGKRAHPPKPIAKINTLKINKKEMQIAFNSALSATANPKYIVKRYKTINDEKDVNVPIVIEGKISELKSKDLIKAVKEILGKKLFSLAIKKRTQRAGKGKLRGRKYKSNAGLILVIGEKEKLKSNSFEVVNVNKLSVTDLAIGGLGRIAIYTENAIKYLEKKL